MSGEAAEHPEGPLREVGLDHARESEVDAESETTFDPTKSGDGSTMVVNAFCI